MRDLATAALLAALLAASAWIAIPLGPVPLTLQVFIVVLVALVSKPGWAAAAVSVYLLIGAAGVPVFAGPRGGLGVLAGPTGGFLVGFLFGASAAAALRALLRRRGAGALLADGVAAGVTVASIYALGWAQLAIVTDMGGVEAALAGVVPFIAPDAAKAAVAVGVASVLRRAGVVDHGEGELGR